MREEDNDTLSVVSSGARTRCSAGTEKRAKKKHNAVLDDTVDFSEYPDTVSRPLVLSECKHMLTDFVQGHVDTFEVPTSKKITRLLNIYLMVSVSRFRVIIFNNPCKLREQWQETPFPKLATVFMHNFEVLQLQPNFWKLL